MSEIHGISPQLLRGLQLKDLGRYADAESAFREALAQDPNSAFALHQLAACQFHLPTKHRDALATIQSAIGFEPNEPEHHLLRAFILCVLEQPKEALDAAELALGLDAYSSAAFTAKAQSFLLLEKWGAAEAAAREALAIDADNSVAANQLAQALRLQNKLAENAAHIAGMLARDPEDAYTHASAGWTALQRGQHREAETHFREALRLNPEFEQAREGLLNSFRARSPLYRAYLRYCFAMQRLTSATRWAVIIGLLLVSRVARLFSGPIGIAFMAVYFLFVLWVWVAKPVGNVLLLFDRFARHALRRDETIEAVVVGSAVSLGISMLLGGVALSSPVFAVLGGGLIASSFPFAMTFTNGSRIGTCLFGAIGGITICGVLLTTLSVWLTALSASFAMSLFVTGCIGCFLSTWLGNVPAFRKAAR